MGRLKQNKWSLQTDHLLTIADLTGEAIIYLIEEAIVLKKQLKEGIPHPHLKGKTLGMIFEKASTRTRVSFEVGMMQLGGHALFLNSKDIQLGRGETVSDTAQVMSRYVDVLMVRTFAHETLEVFSEASSVPVINGLTDPHHPTQVLADLMTIYENKGKLEGLKICYVGDGNNNMTHSLLQAAALTGMHMAVASPTGYEPDNSIFQQAKIKGEQTGAEISYYESPIDAIQHADVVITDVWASMGEENELEERKKLFQPFQVNKELTQNAKQDYLFLHCLPAHREEEVTTEIIDGKHSVVFDEAENRLHAQKALLTLLMGN
ncbi:ornithine carbamoyltransferase [Virgibacillus natechei]|uniref:Ornithine carbamoyltransferase n=1 Tax=Virgibacillus natechei TaxID=1216297 RepID=A0ABS4IGY7_9BACI|nr:ornithine carbamoyltransferase [Virgibacillus natechei]MBP1970133.1 ornithine carbamoyltransferase [Virgibacillus natechei]UZD14207.1 ornithine carbamoyltransferase [Virgibacillus natechei]